MRFYFGLIAYAIATATVFASPSSERQENPVVQELQRFRAYPHLDRAYQLIDEDRLVEAKEELATGLAFDPGNAQARESLVIVLHRLADYEAVIREAEFVVAADNRSAVGLLYRGMARQALGRLEAAEEDFLAASELSDIGEDEKTMALDTLADMAIRQGRYAEALDYLDRLPASSHGFSFSYRRGVALDALGEVVQAVSSYREAIGVAPGVSERMIVSKSLVDLFRRNGEFVQAREALLEALDIDPEDVQLMQSLGEVSYRLGDDAEAIRRTLSVLQSPQGLSDSDRYALHMMLGYAYRRLGQHGQASDAFREAAELQPDSAALIEAAQSLEMSGQTEQTIEWLTKALELNTSPRVPAMLGSLYARAGKSEDAVRYLEEAAKQIEDPSELADLLEQQSHLYLSLGDLKEARLALEKASRLAPERASVFHSLGEICLLSGEAQEAVFFLRKSLDLDDKIDSRVALAAAYTSTGETTLALAIYKELLLGPDIDKAQEGELLLKMAQIESLRAQYSQAAKLFIRAFGCGQPTGVLVRAAESLAMAGEWVQATEVNLQLLDSADVAGSDRAQTFKRLGYAQAAQGEMQKAADSWAAALLLGLEDRDVRLNLALVLYEQGLWTEAIEHLRRSFEQKPAAITLVYTGRCYMGLGKLGVAIHYLEEATADPDELDPEVRKAVMDELSFLYAGQSDYERAVRACEQSLAMTYDPITALRLGRMQFSAGRLEEAWGTLKAIPMDLLRPVERAEVFDELSRIRAQEKDLVSAVELLSDAALLSPSADRDYRLGLFYREVGEVDKATHRLESAVESAPDETRYRLALAYTYEHAGRFDEAARLFAEAVDREPDYISIYKQLGYNRMRSADKEEAAHWFEKAIDVSPFYPATSSKEQTERARDVYHLRREVAQLRNRWDVNAYFGAASQGLPGVGAVEGVGGIPLAAQMGVEFAYQPPRMGLRANRTFQIFGRLLGNELPDVEGREAWSYQAGVGVRYKPFLTQNLSLSGERLFALGETGIDAWLFRGLYSWERGYDLQPGRGRWNYSYVLGDAAHFTGGTGTFLYGEGRKGVTWNLKESILLTPHAIFDAYQRAATEPASSIEGGMGVSLRYLFDETRYQAYRSSLELRLYYKLGRWWTAGLSEGFRGWAAIGAVQF